ncbi:MAG: T9SS type A sorting domain-containing protein [Flavobacteriales bacterium]|nr:T9SS type A sorting domain-containing protein [Flavobacteriales bacterium]
MRAFSTSLVFFLACSLRAISVEIVVQQQPICGHPVGSLFAVANGGVSPYTYSWNTGDNFPSIQGLSAGTYTVTVTDVNADQATAEVVLDALPEWGQIGMGTHLLCDGQAPYGFVSAQYFTIGGDPYTNDLSSAFPLSIDASSTPFFDPAAVPSWVGNGYLVHEGPGPVTVSFTDATGCVGTLYGDIAGDPIEWPEWTSVEAAPSCGPNGNGSITVFRTGGSFASLHGPDNTTYWDTGLDQEEVFQDLDPGGYWLVQNTRTPGPNSFNWDYLPAAQCADSIYVVIPDEGPDCGVLSGTMYIDADEDCSISSGDLSAGYQILVVEPGPRYVSTDLSGQYTANLPLGSYTIQPANPALLPVCPAGATISSLGTPEQLDVPVIGTAGPAPDLHAWLTSSPARPGFVLTYYLHANNINYGASGNVTATFTADPITTVLSASPTPSMINTGSVVWELSDVLPYNSHAFSVQVMVPADVALIGTMLTSGLTLTSSNLDLDPSNNVASYSTVVTGSYDPNDKLASTSTQASDELYFIDQDEWIDYTIRFQNTGTDTAFQVVITDTLAASLDPASLQVGAASHPMRWELGYGDVLRFHFDDILLPDSNTNEPHSHGAVQFRIRPKAPTLPGTLIANTANIYFDFNPPVITEPSVLVAEFSTSINDITSPTLQISPNPATDQVILRGISNESLSSIHVLAIDSRFIKAPLRWSGTAAQLDIRSLAPGTYLIRAPEGQARFVKQ